MANDKAIQDDVGDWTVDADQGYVHLTFTELDQNGILVHEVYMYPYGALDFAQAIKNCAHELIS